MGPKSFLRSLQLNQHMPETANAIDKFSSEVVTSATIGRTPLSAFLTGAIDLLSNNQYSKTVKLNNYDTYFHLFIVFQTSKGPVTAEKNEAVHVAAGNPSASNTQKLNVQFPRTTIGEILRNTRAKQGAKYFRYNASSNNCQQFISDLLHSNGVTDAAVHNWVRQDTESIFRNNPSLRKLANTATDLANVAQGVRQVPTLIQRKIEQKTRPVRSKAADIVRKGIFGWGIGNEQEIRKGSVRKPMPKSRDYKDFLKRIKGPARVRITGLRKQELRQLALERGYIH